MKQLLTATIAASTCVLMGAAAMAADLPTRRAPPAPPPPPVFTWTGAYIGVNAGYAFDAGQRSVISAEDGLGVNLADGTRPSFGRMRGDGFSGVGQIGYNYELAATPFISSNLGFGAGGIVLGVEADASYTDIRSNASYFSDRLSTFSGRTDFVGTARGRLGLAIDNALLYGTGGFAYGSARSGANFYGPTGNLTYTGSSDSLRTGYAYGGGIEYALTPTSLFNVFRASAVTVKAEFIHYDLGSYNLRLANTAGDPAGYNQRIKVSGDIVRLGLNYKFGAIAAAPVVARY